MFKYLWPQEAIFFNNFESQVKILMGVANAFIGIGTDNQNINEQISEIKRLENEADKIVRLSMEALHKTFITPFDREDIHTLTGLLDDIIDEIEAVTDCLLIYKINHLTLFAKECAHILFTCTLEISHLVHYLRERKNIHCVLKQIETISKAKTEAKQITRKALGQLFDEESDVRIIIKWKEIYEHLEKAIDLCDDVANVIEGIILEYS